MEEELWRDKSIINWHLQGDRNTNFFHTYAKIKRKTKMIYSLIIDDKLENDSVILENNIENHFKKLFNSDFKPNESDLINRVIPKLVIEQMNDRMLSMPNPRIYTMMCLILT